MIEFAPGKKLTHSISGHEPTPLPSVPLAERQFGRLPLSRWRDPGRMLQLKIMDDSTNVTTGDGKLIFLIPPELDGTALFRAVAFVSTVSSSGLPTIQVRNITQSLDVLSTKITIDANEYTSITAATPCVIKDKIVYRAGDLIAIDIDVAGTGAQGLGIQLSFQ